MPNQPKDGVRARAFRVPDDLWEVANAKATIDGETISAVLRRLLEDYVKDVTGKG